jgi:hypothetical protein
MYLQTVETSARISEPSDDEIRQYVMSSDGGPGTGVILWKNDYAFMQTAGDEVNGYSIEYVIEYLDEQSRILFHCEGASVEDAVRAMQAYARGADSWKLAFDWEYWGVVTD